MQSRAGTSQTTARCRMSITTDIVLALALAALGGQAHADDAGTQAYGFGTRPSEAELGHFVSPLPDGRGLPQGSGSVLEGKSVYQQQCASCHGEKLQGGLG